MGWVILKKKATPRGDGQQSGQCTQQSSLEKGGANLGQIDLGDNTQVQFTHRFIGGQDFNTPVVEPHDGSGFTGQGQMRCNGQGGSPWNGLGIGEIKVTMAQNEDDPVPSPGGQGELPGPAESLIAGMCILELTERSRPLARRGILC